MSEEIVPVDHGIRLAIDYLNFLVVEEYIPPEVANFFMEMSVANRSPLHYFITEALVDYYIHLNQQPNAAQETESVH